MKVLVADDNKESRYLLEKILQGYGHEVTAVANGAEGLQQALKELPDILVTDILMPQMDGYQLCYEWKRNDKLRDIPVVFYTASYTTGEDEEFALSLGANTFIRKPTEPDVFVQILNEILEKVKSGFLPPPEVPSLAPSLYLTEYNKRIVAKLDQKLAELNIEITERKKAEAELQKVYEELQLAHKELQESQAQLIQAEKMSALGTLAAGIAHELNNPIMGILNFSQHCLKHTSEDDRRYTVLQDIEQETKRCIDIVQNLLTFSRMEGEGEAYQKESCAAIFERILKLLSYRIEKQGASVTYHVADGTPEIWMKVNSIQQVFLNLIANALDALGESEKKEIRVDIRRDGELIQVIIADTGCGIAPENLQKIFDPFFSTKPIGQGTGLGLSISRSMIEAHGGEITCESDPGAGTKFKILLPMERRKENE